MTQLTINCPKCNNNGKVTILDEIMKNVSRGLLAVNIAEGIVCEHTFIVYIDKNFDIRDYFIADFHVPLPQRKSDDRKLKEKKILEKDVVDIDLIKLFLPGTILSYLIKAIVSGSKIIILSEEEFLYNHITNFIKYITQNSFDSEILIISENDYKNNKKKYKKEYIVLNGKQIVNNLNKLIDVKRLKIEKQIVNRFINDSEQQGFSYIILKNDLTIAFELCIDIMDLIKKTDSKVKIGKKDLIKMIEDKDEFKISFEYLEFLLDIIKNYFKFDLSIISDHFIPILGI